MGQGRYEFRDKAVKRDRMKELNPVWRGVGCVLLVLMGVGGYWFGSWFLRANAQNNWVYLPPELFYPPFLPQWLPSGLVVRLALGLLFVIVGYGVLSFVYALLFPVQRGEHDAPPMKRKRKRSRWRSKGR